MRLFVAVDVPAPRRVDDSPPTGSTVTTHLTLRFLGEVGPDRLTTVTNAVDRAVEKFSVFDLVLEGVGTFPPGGRPRIVWVGVTTGARELNDLAARVSAELAKEGFPTEDRPFQPHVTVLRVRGTRDLAEVRRWREGANRPFGVVRVRAVFVKQSELKASGAIHTVVHRAPLAEMT